MENIGNLFFAHNFYNSWPIFVQLWDKVNFIHLDQRKQWNCINIKICGYLISLWVYCFIWFIIIIYLITRTFNIVSKHNQTTEQNLIVSMKSAHTDPMYRIYLEYPAEKRNSPRFAFHLIILVSPSRKSDPTVHVFL